MTKPISFALLIGGIVLLVWGMNASDSFSSDVSRVFTGEPTNRAMWLTIGGAVAGALGLFGIVGSRKVV